jgi:hypothetical protein
MEPTLRPPGASRLHKDVVAKKINIHFDEKPCVG